MLFCTNISKSFGPQTLLTETDFVIHPTEKIGLVGRNGSGKSTLLQLILGNETPDEGRIQVPERYCIGALSQHLTFEKDTIRDEVAQSLPSEHIHDLWRAEKLLSGLGFSVTDFERSPSEFSGGYQTRIKLAQLLISQPDLLILDEPTNYLDILSIRWLENFLRTWKSEILCVSHDHNFLKNITTHTALIHRQKIRKLQGPPAKVYTQIEHEEIIHEKTRINEQKERNRQEKFIREFRSGARSAGLVQSRIKMLEKKESLRPLPKIPPINFHFPEKEFFGDRIGQVNSLCFSYNGGEELLHNLSFEIHPGDKIGIIGQNGKGKTTLLRLLGQELSPTRGTLKYNKHICIGSFGQSNKERLNPQKTILEELTLSKETKEQHVRSIAGSLLFRGDQAKKKISVLSGGEKSRVNLGKLLITETNLLLLDEPTNHLDYESIEALITAMKEYAQTLIFVTHDEYFLEHIANKLIVFDDGTVQFFRGGYTQFLQEKGFTKETLEITPQKKPPKNALSREQKKAFQKQIRPLKRTLDRLEKNIETLEQEHKKTADTLWTAQKKGNHAHVDLSAHDLAKIEKKLSPLLQEWEDVGRQIETLENRAQFDNT